MEISKLQQQIIYSPKNKIVVISAAGSGKTLCLTERLRYLLKQGVAPENIAAITFTNNAADTMVSRLGEDYKKGLFIGTIHSLANNFLLSAGISTDKYLEGDKFDELFELVKKNPHCVKHIDYILLDEAQDSDELQFDFIFNNIKPNNFFIIGDCRQSIYQWKGSDPELLMDLARDKEVTVYNLNQNYRNGYDILNFAKRIIKPTGLDDNSVSLCKYESKVVETEFSFVKLKKIIDALPKEQYRDFAILTRTNADIDRIGDYLTKYDIPFDTFKQAQLSNEELKQKMEQNTIKILTIHSAKGLEWRYVTVVGARFFPEPERYVSYVAATRAKERLIWTTTPKKKKTTFNWEN